MAEAAAIAEMERQALEMSAKRAELQADMSNKLQLEDTMKQEAQLIARKREAIEDKMRKEEEELQKLSDEAKQRVLEKMAAEAAAIADMEREANKLAEERAILASQIAEQRSSKPAEGTVHQEVSPTPLSLEGVSQPHQAEHVDTQVASLSIAPEYYGSDVALEPTGDVDAENPTQGVANAGSLGLTANQAGSELTNSTAAGSGALYPENIRANNADLELAGDAGVDNGEWTEQQIPTLGEPIDLNVCAHCRVHQRDLSPAHLAAAAGHVTCLEAIQLGQRELLAEVDSSGRSPLFYACANAHADAADLLIQEGPQSCQAMDLNGDTPLHAAALAGSRLCCRLLLQEGQSDVEPRNQMQMTPAHLAANNDVLEVLSQHGANLNAKVSETPLFLKGIMLPSLHVCRVQYSTLPARDPKLKITQNWESRGSLRLKAMSDGMTGHLDQPERLRLRVDVPGCGFADTIICRLRLRSAGEGGISVRIARVCRPRSRGGRQAR